MIVNGRQAAPTLEGIRDDHLNRYRVAQKLAVDECLETAVDLGSGIGYGAWMLASIGMKVTAIERDREAIAYGEKHYPHRCLVRRQDDLRFADIPGCDIITAFEVVEHMTESPAILLRASTRGKWLIASVPNEDVVPFGQKTHREHVRHYTPDEFKAMLAEAGWDVKLMMSQRGKTGQDAEVTMKGEPGRTLVAVARSRWM